VGDAPVNVFIVQCTGSGPAYGPGCDADYKPGYGTVCDNNGANTHGSGYLVVPGAGEGLNQGVVRPMAKAPGGPGALRRIPLGIEPGPLAISPRTGTIYIVNEGSNDVTPIRV
jgi:hypothetical protein